MPVVKTFVAAVLRVFGGLRCSDSLPCSEVGTVLRCSDKGSGFTPAP